MCTQQHDDNNMHTTGYPITCPHCSSRNMEFVAEYRKLWGLRIANIFVLIISAIFVYGFIDELKKGNPPSLIYAILTFFSVIVFLAFCIIIIIFESRTHIKAVCRDCGHIWEID